MVALNLQTVDPTTNLNRSLFELNGGCGYVLKPPHEAVPRTGLRLRLRVLSAHHLPKTRDERSEPQPWDVYLPHLSCAFQEAHLSSSDVVSPQIEVEVVGGLVVSVGGDLAEASAYRTWKGAPCASNGLCVAWDAANEEPCACDLWAPSASFVRVSVYNSRPTLLGSRGKGPLLASEVVPVQALRHGYRSLQLRSPNGCRIEACRLLLHIEKQHITRAAVPVGRGAHHKAGARGSVAWSNLRLSSLAKAGVSSLAPRISPRATHGATTRQSTMRATRSRRSDGAE